MFYNCLSKETNKSQAGLLIICSLLLCTFFLVVKEIRMRDLEEAPQVVRPYVLGRVPSGAITWAPGRDWGQGSGGDLLFPLYLFIYLNL